MTGARLGCLATLALTLAACEGGGGEGGGAGATTGAEAPTEVRLVEIDEPPPTAKRLLGTWSQTGAALLLRFSPDGTFAFDRRTLEAPFARGTYELAAGRISFTATGPGCADSWRWQTGIAKAKDRFEDELHIVFLDAGCEIPAGAEWRFARIPGD